jgi:hypothetical protein
MRRLLPPPAWACLLILALATGFPLWIPALVSAAPPSIGENVAIVDPYNPQKQAGVDSSGNLQVNCIAGCSAGSGTGANNADGVAPVSTGLGSSVGYGFVWNGTGWDRQTGSASLGTTGNVANIGGNAVNTGNGTTGTGTQRVTLSSDSTGQVKLAAGANTIGALTANQSVNTAQVNGVTVLTGTGATGTGAQRVTVSVDSATVAGSASLPAGTSVIGKAGIDQTTPGTTNAVQAIAGTTGGTSVSRTQAANNTTGISIKGTAGTVYGVRVFNNSTTVAYAKLYNKATAPTCGTDTVVDQIMIPANASGAGAVVPMGGPAGVAYGTGIGLCITTGFADSDTTAPAASTYVVSVDYK